MPRRRALINDAAVPAPVRPAPDMSVLPYAAVRRMARHTWFHDPVFPFVHLANLRPRRPRRSTRATTPGAFGSRSACARASSVRRPPCATWPQVAPAGRAVQVLPRLWRRTQLRPCSGRRESRPRPVNSGEPQVGVAWLPTVLLLPGRQLLERQPPRPMPDFSGLGSKDAAGPATPAAERRSPDPQLRPGMMAGRPAGSCRPSSSGLPGPACGGSWGAGAVQLVWRSGCRVGRGRGDGAAETGGVGEVEPAGRHCRA